MRAVVHDAYGPPEVLRLEERAVPEPGPREVRIRVRAVEATKSDCELRSYRLSVVWYWLPMRLATGVLRPRRTFLGLYFSGVVDACGRDVTRFTPGDAVFGSTGFAASACADYLCLPERAALAPKPPELTFAEAAALPLGGTNALHFLKLGAPRPGERLLVVGAGASIGSLGVQIGRALGAEVDAVDAGHKRAFLEGLGVRRFFDYRRERFLDAGERWDLILDMVAQRDYGGCVRALNPGGRYLLAVPRFPDLARAPLTSRFTDRRVRVAFARESRRTFAEVGAFMVEHDLRPTLDALLPLEDVVRAHRRVESEERCGMVVLDVSDAAARS